MNNKYLLSLAFFAVILVSSCIPSLHPLYTKDKIVYLRQLEGEWVDFAKEIEFSRKQKVLGEEKDVTVTIHDDHSLAAPIWHFMKAEDNGYLLIHQDEKGRKAAFDVYVVQLGKDYFLDFYLAELPKSEKERLLDVNLPDLNQMASYHKLPVHTFAKLIIVNDEIKIKMFDPDFLSQLLKNRQIRIKHEALENGDFVLTAPSEDLQKFVSKYTNHKDAYFDEVIALTKK